MPSRLADALAGHVLDRHLKHEHRTPLTSFLRISMQASCERACFLRATSLNIIASFELFMAAFPEKPRDKQDDPPDDKEYQEKQKESLYARGDISELHVAGVRDPLPDLD